MPTDVAKRAQEVVDARARGDRQRADWLMRHLEEWYEARVRRAEAKAPPDTAKVVRLRANLAEARRYVDRETAAVAEIREPRSEAESEIKEKTDALQSEIKEIKSEVSEIKSAVSEINSTLQAVLSALAMKEC